MTRLGPPRDTRLMSADVEALAAELGMTDPAARDELALLSGEQSAALLNGVRDARRAQQDTIARAIDGAMEHVPKLLRSALRRILF